MSNKLYSRLNTLQRELLKNMSDEERESLEEEIADIEDEIALEQSGKYEDDLEDY